MNSKVCVALLCACSSLCANVASAVSSEPSPGVWQLLVEMKVCGTVSASGIVVGFSDDTLFVVSAGHVVPTNCVGKSVVTFTPHRVKMPSIRAEAHQIGSPSLSPDLVVFSVGLTSSLKEWLGSATWSVLTRRVPDDGDSVRSLTRIRIGHDEVAKGQEAAQKSGKILFRSNLVSSGDSGSGLFDSEWKLVGLIVESQDSEWGFAIDIHMVLHWLQENLSTVVVKLSRSNTDMCLLDFDSASCAALFRERSCTTNGDYYVREANDVVNTAKVLLCDQHVSGSPADEARCGDLEARLMQLIQLGRNECPLVGPPPY